MLAAHPPRIFVRPWTRKLTLRQWILSGRMWSLNDPGKFMMWSNATEPVTPTSRFCAAMTPLTGRERITRGEGPNSDLSVQKDARSTGGPACGGAPEGIARDL